MRPALIRELWFRRAVSQSLFFLSYLRGQWMSTLREDNIGYLRQEINLCTGFQLQNLVPVMA